MGERRDESIAVFLRKATIIRRPHARSLLLFFLEWSRRRSARPRPGRGRTRSRAKATFYPFTE
jgi:hypothetical protein